MKILLITDEEWNDIVFGNGVLTNWFTDFPAEFAQIYISPGLPNNHVCKKYFQITDGQMVHSLFGGEKAGREIQMMTDTKQLEATNSNARRKGVYGFMKKLSLWCRTPVLIIQDAIWEFGKYDKSSLKKFVDDFNPDVVFCPRFFTPRLKRLEKLICTMTEAPFVAFTADNEASLNCYTWSPLFWLRRLAIHHSFKRHVGLYRHYFMFSEEQAQDYHQQYGLPTSCLFKCGTFSEKFDPKPVNKPIRMIYAGRLYCNRWKTLAAIGDALEQLNVDDVKVVLDIFTAEALTRRQEKALLRFNYLHIHSAITPTQLVEEYKKADIALHVESFDKEFRLATRYSFSTKIIDLMASSCAILAICWEKHAGYQYLKQHDAAFCISSYDDIFPMVDKICGEPTLISEYAEKAWKCGKDNHTSEIIQRQIKDTFEKVIAETDDKQIF
jgi:hypothetical protein